MTPTTKAEIGTRLRQKREEAGYTRERLGELCSLSPRFIANIELGDSTFSLDSLMNVCKVLSCSSDYLLFGTAIDRDAWSETTEKIVNLDIRYKDAADKVIQGFVEAISSAEK